MSSKYLTAFSDFRSPENPPPDTHTHLTFEEYGEYLEQYAEKFGVTPCISFQVRGVCMRV